MITFILIVIAIAVADTWQNCMTESEKTEFINNLTQE